MINYGYTMFAMHCIVKLKCNMLRSSADTLCNKLFPELIINAGKKDNSFIIRGCLPATKLDEFREELNKRMITYKISKLQEQLNNITKSSYAMAPEDEAKYNEQVTYAEDIF